MSSFTFTISRKIPRSCPPQIAALRDSILDKLARPVFRRLRVLLPESRLPYVPNRKSIPANGAEPGSKSRFLFRCWREIGRASCRERVLCCAVADSVDRKSDVKVEDGDARRGRTGMMI